jgi:hypothetical protein
MSAVDTQTDTVPDREPSKAAFIFAAASCWSAGSTWLEVLSVRLICTALASRARSSRHGAAGGRWQDGGFLFSSSRQQKLSSGEALMRD